MINTVFEIPTGVFAENVKSVQHYTDRLFKFRISRPNSFRFRSGEFVMIGLPNAEKPIFRAYSIASPAWDEELEFYSIKVEDGPLTQHLQNIKINDIEGSGLGLFLINTLMDSVEYKPKTFGTKLKLVKYNT